MLLATDIDIMLGGVLDQLKLVMGKQVFEPLFLPVSYGFSHLHKTHSGCETIFSRRCLLAFLAPSSPPDQREVLLPQRSSYQHTMIEINLSLLLLIQLLLPATAPATYCY